MKKIIVVLFVVVIASMVLAGFVFDKPHEIYPTSMIVTEIDYENDLVTIVDFNGNAFQFFGCEDWCENDICAVSMDDNGTPETIYDDIISQVRYCGYIQ